jgi:hypothetical protein
MSCITNAGQTSDAAARAVGAPAATGATGAHCPTDIQEGIAKAKQLQKLNAGAPLDNDLMQSIRDALAEHIQVASATIVNPSTIRLAFVPRPGAASKLHVLVIGDAGDGTVILDGRHTFESEWRRGGPTTMEQVLSYLDAEANEISHGQGEKL